MRSAIAQRVTRLEESILPLTASALMDRARKLARRRGLSLSAARDSLIAKATDSELKALAAEFEQIVFGSDTAARDAAKREVFAAAGIPDWSVSPDAKSEVEGW
jgi:pantoate kinase